MLRRRGIKITITILRRDSMEFNYNFFTVSNGLEGDTMSRFPFLPARNWAFDDLCLWNDCVYMPNISKYTFGASFGAKVSVVWFGLRQESRRMNPKRKPVHNTRTVHQQKSELFESFSHWKSKTKSQVQRRRLGGWTKTKPAGLRWWIVYLLSELEHLHEMPFTPLHYHYPTKVFSTQVGIFVLFCYYGTMIWKSAGWKTSKGIIGYHWEWPH